jgi:hypothetical protein
MFRKLLPLIVVGACAATPAAADMPKTMSHCSAAQSALGPSQGLGDQVRCYQRAFARCLRVYRYHMSNPQVTRYCRSAARRSCRSRQRYRG